MTEGKAFYLIITTSILTVISPGLYGVLGSLGYYAHLILQGKETFNWGFFFIYIFLGFVVALMVSDLSITVTGTSYPGLMIASGFSVRKAVTIADKYLGLSKVL